MPVKLGHIELFVHDPIAAKDFYLNVLGFSLIDIQAGKFVWVSSGAFSILLRPGAGSEMTRDYADAASALVLYTDDLDETAADFTERGLIFQGTDGSPRCLTFTDPDGHWFQLVNPKDH